MTTIFGIRHHGPGSAKSLVKALDNYKPDAILIEGPPDANNIIHHVANSELVPPVAILVYNPKDLRQAAYFPFAEFSPEWQAIKYALKHGIPVEFMDLPQNKNFTLQREEALQKQQKLDFQQLLPDGTEAKKDETKNPKKTKVRKDPLGYIAEIAGYSDSERWWETTLENRSGDGETFKAVLELMTAVRSELQIEETSRDLRREAYMREGIRKAQKSYQRVAFVCGAWHGPVIADVKKFKAATDKKILRGIKKTTTKATWVPWTYERLSYLSGYGAGVLSPAWYKLLFTNKSDIVEEWMTKVARLFRTEDLDASSAHAIEAVRLANTLAAIRDLPVAGINELREAAITIFCEGHEEPLQLIDKKLIIGDIIGEIPDDIPVVPLQDDLNKSIKSARLTKEKNTASEVEKTLDLRIDSNKLASQLLHRLNILDIEWGTIKEADRSKKRGGFQEWWTLKWQPEFAIDIIEASMWGNTVYSAAVNAIQQKARDAEGLGELTAYVEQALNAGLDDAMHELSYRLKNSAAITRDINQLIKALPPLVNIVKYGNTRGTNTDMVTQILEGILPRIFIGLPSACVNLNEDAAKEMFEQLQTTNRVIYLLNEEDYNAEWNEVLAKIAAHEHINGILTGACTRILFDKNHITQEETEQTMQFALSQGNDSMAAAQWIEGFLHGSGLLLIHRPSLWRILDNWVDGLPMDLLNDILPLLRRTFSNFSPPERQKMLSLAKKGTSVSTTQKVEQGELNMERAKEVIPMVMQLLGL